MTTTSESASRWRRAWAAAPLVLAALALVHPLANRLARLDWRIDLFTHFQGPALALTVCAAAAALPRHKRLAACLALLAVTQVPPLARYNLRNPVQADPHARERLHVLMANVLADNQDHDRLAQLIQRERPDVVGLVEVDLRWIHGLERVRAEFPYRVEFATGTRGLALWFRTPPIAIDPPLALVPDGNAFIHARLMLGGMERHLWLVHPRNPLGSGRHSCNAELVALAERIRQTPGSHLVIGDLNRTDGSPYFRDFLRSTGLRDSRLGFGRQPSWPVWSPYRIAIDHAFLSPDLAVLDRRLGPNIGSDHRPLVVDLVPAAPSPSGLSARTSSWAHASQGSP